jgi:hypothetical protein
MVYNGLGAEVSSNRRILEKFRPSTLRHQTLIYYPTLPNIGASMRAITLSIEYNGNSGYWLLPRLQVDDIIEEEE